MDKDAEKRYRDLTPKERYDSAVAAGDEPWNPLQTAKDLIKEKLGNKDVTKVMPSMIKPMAEKIADKILESDKNVAKGIEIKAGKVEKDKPYKLNPVEKKKGGMIKKMAKGGSVSSASKRADGCATKGKTKGRII